jgi:hypothetical protein
MKYVIKSRKGSPASMGPNDPGRGGAFRAQLNFARRCQSGEKDANFDPAAVGCCAVRDAWGYGKK